jgi:hypothetical protein
VRRTPLAWYQLRWPREITAEQTIQCWRLMAAAAGVPIIVEAVGRPSMVDHYLAVPRGRAGAVVHQLRATIPGLALESVSSRPNVDVRRAVELRLSTHCRSLRTDETSAINRAALIALAHVSRNERLILQWTLGRSLTPISVPNQLDGLSHESLLLELLTAPFGRRQTTDPEVRNALRVKQAEPGWRGLGRIGVQAGSSSRQRQLIGQVIGALRSAEAPGVGFRVLTADPRSLIQANLPWRFPLRLNVDEFASLAAWPVGSTSELPVSAVGSRAIPPTNATARSGRIVGEATFPGHERLLALSPKDSLRHLHVLGPTGSGKSTLFLNLIKQDMVAGRGVVVIEPKGDLINEVLEHIPPERVDDVVLLDPTDSGRPVGMNPLARAGRSPELVADQLLGLFHSLYAANWGPRTSDILGSALLSLARIPGMTLVALPLLLTDANFRRRVLPSIVDPIALEPFWAAFESWSEAERATAIAPSMNKLRPFLLRPELRAIIGQAQPRFDVQEVFTKRKIFLVNLAKGRLGPETSALLGSLVIAQLWQAALGRSAIEPKRRHSVFVYVDEFQDYLKLPVDFADALSQARGLGVGFALGHQYLHQLDPAMRSAVLTNAQSRVAFRLPNEDAKLVATGSKLEPDDFQSLGAFQCYAQLVAGGSVQPWCSARTVLPGPPTSDPAAVRDHSQQNYGFNREEVEAAIRDLVSPRKNHGTDDLAPRRRKARGDS